MADDLTCPNCGTGIPDPHSGWGTAVRVASFGGGLFLAITGLVVIASEVAWKLMHAFGLHGGESHVGDDLWGLGYSLMIGIAALAVGMVFMMGAPGDAGREILNGIAGFIGRFSPGKGE